MSQTPALEPPTAKRLIVSLMNARRFDAAPIRGLVAVGAVFGIEESAIRVAAARLVEEGMLATVERGVYAIGPAAASLRASVTRWSEVEARTAPWNGGWITVHAGHLGRSDKKRVRGRERALRRNGLAPALPGLWVRPANLKASLEEARARLVAFGLDADALVTAVDGYAGPDEMRFETLWPAAEIERRYRTRLAQMAESTPRIRSAPPAEAIREAFLLGEAVIRDINLDPLLPAEMIDVGARRAMIAAMVDYNDLGLDAWRRCFAAVA